jgi:hypothetical protein
MIDITGCILTLTCTGTLLRKGRRLGKVLLAREGLQLMNLKTQGKTALWGLVRSQAPGITVNT